MLRLGTAGGFAAVFGAGIGSAAGPGSGAGSEAVSETSEPAWGEGRCLADPVAMAACKCT